MEILPNLLLCPWQDEHWNELIIPLLDRKITSINELEETLDRMVDVNQGDVDFFRKYFSSNTQNPTIPLKGGNQSQTKITQSQFFEDILPFIQNLVLKSADLFAKNSFSSNLEDNRSYLGDYFDAIKLYQIHDQLPLLISGEEQAISLSRLQCACLLANAFFCTFDRVQGKRIKTTNQAFPQFSLTAFYTGGMFTHVSAMECIMHYFLRVSKEEPKGNLIITRLVLEKEQIPSFATSNKKLCQIEAHSDGTIEDCKEANTHADFANQYIGGGVLHGGCVQEEILFLTKPECLVSLLLCAKMEDNEAIVITGAERYSLYTGYGHSFRYGGDYFEKDDVKRFPDGTIMREIVAMDALVLCTHPILKQFEMKPFSRELNKAFIAFKKIQKGDDKITNTIATGNWGCGAFGGNKELKFLIQYLAASEQERDMLYYTFKDEKLKNSINLFVLKMQEYGIKTVGELYNLYVSVQPSIQWAQNFNILEYIVKKMNK